MRQTFFAAFASCVGLLAVATPSAQAHAAYAVLATTGYEQPAGPVGGSAAVTAPDVAATMVFTGYVKTIAGPLAGAVVKIANSSEMAVTDANGAFRVTVPGTTSPVLATTSYAGFADQLVTLDTTSSEVNMSVVHIIKATRKQQLKTCLKTARK